MHRNVERGMCAACVLSALLLSGGCVKPRPVTSESDKIEHLIAYVASMKGVTIAVGLQEFEPAAMAERLRAAWQARRGEALTARDFIRLIATFSEETGQRYLVRREGGNAGYLSGELVAELGRYERELWRKN